MNTLSTLIDTHGTGCFVGLMIGFIIVCAVVAIDQIRLERLRAKRFEKIG